MPVPLAQLQRHFWLSPAKLADLSLLLHSSQPISFAVGHRNSLTVAAPEVTAIIIPIYILQVGVFSTAMVVVQNFPQFPQISYHPPPTTVTISTFKSVNHGYLSPYASFSK